jgi:hypothetical protein
LIRADSEVIFQYRRGNEITQFDESQKILLLNLSKSFKEKFIIRDHTRKAIEPIKSLNIVIVQRLKMGCEGILVSENGRRPKSRKTVGPVITKLIRLGTHY